MGVGLLKRRAGEAARAAIWQSSKAGKWWAHQGKSGLMTAPSSAGGRCRSDPTLGADLRASGVSFTTGKRFEHRCAGSNIAIAGPSLVRPHFQVRSHSLVPPRSQVRLRRLGCHLRPHPARNQVAHRCAVCERNRHAGPAASPAGVRTERTLRCGTLRPVCPGPLRDLQNYPLNRVPQQ